MVVLDIEPDAGWVDAFMLEFEKERESLGLKAASVEGRSYLAASPVTLGVYPCS